MVRTPTSIERIYIKKANIQNLRRTGNRLDTRRHN
jgi:hypothetical protein